MYRLTITQASDTEPYIVVDCDTLEQCSMYLKQYRKDVGLDVFINYDIIEYNELLVDSSELDNLDFSDIN